ncbi:hypothetical protein [Pseudomonas costantinii]|uniref:Uncharacterized protein n=1 Tax=Pseudomonas costantinii TaxID=168469 RepID=A0A1S2V2Y4_9PSED|nr:hypothetical protein [Pseudomonas costantinii]OIN53132.1 hypothetical protein BFL40_11890 [Pseudomonas costantinii]SED22000.1 hypothetical protein SAMN04515675_0310 [Pseudomonas costantinii]
MGYHRAVQKLVFTSALIGLTSCASQHDFTAVPVTERVKSPKVPGGDIAVLSELHLDLVPLYEKDGHIATSGFIASMLGLDRHRIESLSCYSQAPDDLAVRYSAPLVAVWGLPAYTGYRHDILNSLHSLHGGNGQAVAYRRSKLEILVHQSFLTNQPDWQTGFLIHALGDSYAHVYSQGGQLHAYGEFVGHAFENTPWGEKPDSIFVNGHAETYLSYVSALFRSLSPAGGANEERKNLLATFKARVRVEAEKGDDADKTAIFVMPKDSNFYTDIENSDKDCKQAYRRLNDGEVRLFLRALTLQLIQPKA